MIKTMKQFLLIVSALLLCNIASAQGLRIDDLGNRNVIVRIDDLSKNYLLLPVQEDVPESGVFVTVNGVAEPVRNVRLAVDRVDYMVPLDLASYRGKTVALDIHVGEGHRRTDVNKDICWSKMELSDEFSVENIEKYRPVFHHTPKYGWMNDPNGMFYKDGVWHLYYQFNPYGSMWGNMHWAHSTSTDLVNWEHQPVAIAPDQWGTIFSGSAVVDVNNTSGFGENAVVAMYTSAGITQKQSIAYSLDGGLTFTKYDGNPVVTAPQECRDPKVFWNEEAGCWNCVLVSPLEYEAWFYTSKDLKNWTKESEFGGHGVTSAIWECPDIVKLTDPETGVSKWVLLININPGGPAGGSATQYFVGEFDGKTFVCDSAPEVVNWLDYGKDHYATVTWNHAPEGRTVAMAWMSNWQYANQLPTRQFRSANSVARELALIKTQDGSYRVSVVPSKEIETLRNGKPLTSSFSAGSKGRAVALPSSLCDIDMKFAARKGSKVTIRLSNENGEHADLVYDGNSYIFDRAESGIVDFSNDFAVPTTAPASPASEQHIRMILDVSSVEMFDGKGWWAMTNLVYPTSPFTKLEVISENGTCRVKSLKVYNLSQN